MGQVEVQVGGETCRSKEMLPTGVISFTDSTLRDGEQCKVAEVSTKERIKVFDQIVSTGIDIIEVGHGGNDTDWDLITAIVNHTRGDPARYEGVKIQVLFGSQEDIITQRSTELSVLLTEEEKDRFVFHIYDREDEHLRGLASKEYSREESASKIAAGITIAREYGFRNFSISGEGATGSSPEEAAEFYESVIQEVFAGSSEGIDYFNINLANTYGKTMGEDTAWSRERTTQFVQRVRRAARMARREKPISLSIHSHSDYGTATGSSIFNLECGFDRVEGTMFGMGERLGNVALCDVMLCLTERAREATRNELPFFAGRVICKSLIENIGNWHDACLEIAKSYSFGGDSVKHDIFFKFKREQEQAGSGIQVTTEAFRRLWATAFGDPAAFEAGSGPHDHGTKGHFERPNQTPGWQQYLYSSLVRRIMGDPKAKRVIDFDPELAKEITIGKHTGGGSTAKIQSGEIDMATQYEYSEARDRAEELAGVILNLMNPNFTLAA
jgi:isopropylmalate/homocitrate/citramalate synthase